MTPGRFNIWFAKDPNAVNARSFIQSLSKVRYKYRDYLALGSMQRIPKVTAEDDISSNWGDENVTIKQVQAGAYCNQDNSKLMLFTVNASINYGTNFTITVPENNCGASTGKVISDYIKAQETMAFEIDGDHIIKQEL